MTQYRFFASFGPETIEASSDLIALRMARFVTGRSNLERLERWNGERWVAINATQMLYGQNAKENLKAAYGSASARTFKRALREFEAA